MELLFNMLRFSMEKAKEIYDYLFQLAIKLGINLKYWLADFWVGFKLFAVEFVNIVKGFF